MVAQVRGSSGKCRRRAGKTAGRLPAKRASATACGSVGRYWPGRTTGRGAHLRRQVSLVSGPREVPDDDARSTGRMRCRSPRCPASSASGPMGHRSPPQVRIPWRHQRAAPDFGHCRVSDQPAPGGQPRGRGSTNMPGDELSPFMTPSVLPVPGRESHPPPSPAAGQALPCPDGPHLGEIAGLVRLGGGTVLSWAQKVAPDR